MWCYPLRISRLRTGGVGALCLLVPVLSPILQAAPISWGTATDAAAPTDVVTTGALVEAINAGTASGVTTVNGVTFEPSNSLLPNSSGTDFLSGQTTLDEAFDQVLGTLDYGGGTSTSISVGDGRLVAGQAYLVQVFYTDLRGCCADRLMTFGDGAGIGHTTDGTEPSALRIPIPRYRVRAGGGRARTG